MALTTAQQSIADDLKDEIKRLKEWVEMSPSTLSNGGHGMFFFDHIQKMENAMKKLEEA